MLLRRETSRIRTTMDRSELKERREATDCANSEFNRVKRAKLENERAKCRLSRESQYDEKAVKQLDRERANRASAAASRAKIVCYARELEKRTDRLERDRNAHALRADKAIKRLRVLREETKKLKDVLRQLWQLKDPKTCSYLVDSNALFLLATNNEADDKLDDDLILEEGNNNEVKESKKDAELNDYYPSVLPPPPPVSSTTTTVNSPLPPPPPPVAVPAPAPPAQSTTPRTPIVNASNRTVVSPTTTHRPYTTAPALPQLALVHSTSLPTPPAPIPQPHYHPSPYPYPVPSTTRQPYVLAPPIPRCTSTTTEMYAPAPLVGPRPMYYATSHGAAPVIPPIRVPGETKREQIVQERRQLPPLP